jgi:hypothetical protein
VSVVYNDKLLAVCFWGNSSIVLLVFEEADRKGKSSTGFCLGIVGLWSDNVIWDW